MPRTEKNIVLTQEQYDGLIQRLDDLSKGQAEIKLELASRKHIDETVQQDHALLLGNGKPGFVAVREEVLEWKDDKKYYSRMILGVAITNAISLATAAFIWFVKIYPVIEKLGL